jgi:predicted 3-demethylubiquinone-9 3-methyltransferase (glyoxalase superfamily)
MNSKITTCLWFDTQAEEAARYYVSIFKNSRITTIAHYPDAGEAVHGKKAGTVLIVAFELDGCSFTALNGGPHFKFNEAISLQVDCATQEEVDYFTEKLGAGGDPDAQQCGWVQDKYGVSWQVVPSIVTKLLTGPAPEKSARAFAAIMEMKKIDIAAVQRAYDSEG